MVILHYPPAGRWFALAARLSRGLFILMGLSSVAWAGHEGELIRLVRQDCGSCHGMTLKGGLGSPLTADALRDKPLESLAATILHGRPGTAMPAWKSILNEGEALWIARKLVEGFPEEKH